LNILSEQDKRSSAREVARIHRWIVAIHEAMFGNNQGQKDK